MTAVTMTPDGKYVVSTNKDPKGPEGGQSGSLGYRVKRDTVVQGNSCGWTCTHRHSCGRHGLASKGTGKAAGWATGFRIARIPKPPTQTFEETEVCGGSWCAEYDPRVESVSLFVDCDDEDLGFRVAQIPSLHTITDEEKPILGCGWTCRKDPNDRVVCRARYDADDMGFRALGSVSVRVSHTGLILCQRKVGFVLTLVVTQLGSELLNLHRLRRNTNMVAIGVSSLGILTCVPGLEALTCRIAITC
jgi:hypothetical protein